MCIQEKLIDWANETVNVYNTIAETLNKNNPSKKWGYYTQTPLSLVSQSPDLLILGINPGAEGGKDNMTGEELLKGNPCFDGLDKKSIVKAMCEDRDDSKKRNGWALWHRLNNMLKNTSNHKELLQDFNRFVLSNMIFFGTAKENQIPQIDKDKCAERTLKLIDNLEPKVVILLGKQCRDLYNRLNKGDKLEVLIPNSIFHCMYGKSHILAIKHTAYYYSSEEMAVVGKTIGYILDHHDETIDKETINASYIKEDISHFEERQNNKQHPNDEKLNYLLKKIIAEGSNQWVDDNDKLVYEYFCGNSANKFIKENGTISIGIFYQNKQCCFSVMTKGNNPEGFLKKVQETCDELKVFKMDSNDSFVADVGTDDGKIIEFFNVLLSRIKDYRETDFPK